MIRLNPIFRDHAVFQAGKPVRVFGTGSGEVRVSFLGEEKTIYADGKEAAVVRRPVFYGAFAGRT